jgi:1,4-dihydroxy-2-naphthoate octaprenyltransferase
LFGCVVVAAAVLLLLLLAAAGCCCWLLLLLLLLMLMIQKIINKIKIDCPAHSTPSSRSARVNNFWIEIPGIKQTL